MKGSYQCFIASSIVLATLLPALAQDAPFRGRLRQMLQNRKTTHSAPNDREEGTTAVTIQSDGTPRVYHVHVPPGYQSSKPTPLVLVYHGGGGTGLYMARLSKMNRVSDEQGFIAVYPDGLQKHWNDGRTKLSSERPQDDVSFTKDILEKLESEINIDKNRIYACGMSNGGLFSQRLACEIPNILAAAASLAANFPADRVIVPSKPFSIMYILGTNDPIMPFKGGDIRGFFGEGLGKVLSADQSVETWITYDQCPPTPVRSTYGEKNANLSIDSKIYRPGVGGTEVVYCAVRGGGHCWPGGQSYLPAKIVGHTSSINANEIIWNFFKRHKLGE